MLDLGSGGGIDVLLSARRVGPPARPTALDMTDEMLELARANAARGRRDERRVPEGHDRGDPAAGRDVDVVISNCVINLSTDKPAVFAEVFRVLRPAAGSGSATSWRRTRLDAAARAERGSYVGCIAGALSRGEYEALLAAAGFADVDRHVHARVADGIHGAIVKARRPGLTIGFRRTTRPARRLFAPRGRLDVHHVGIERWHLPSIDAAGQRDPRVLFSTPECRAVAIDLRPR